MAKGKADIANFSIRIFLQKVGMLYDELRGFDPFKPTRTQWIEVLGFFDNQCCYCRAELAGDNATEDHLIPLNKTAVGLHAWGNVVPCCAQCNKQKHGKNWIEFLQTKSSDLKIFNARKNSIEKFQQHYKYNPNLELATIASNLYEDAGAVVMTLVDLRFKQAEQVIKDRLKSSR